MSGSAFGVAVEDQRRAAQAEALAVLRQVAARHHQQPRPLGPPGPWLQALTDDANDGGPGCAHLAARRGPGLLCLDAHDRRLKCWDCFHIDLGVRVSTGERACAVCRCPAWAIARLRTAILLADTGLVFTDHCGPCTVVLPLGGDR